MLTKNEKKNSVEVNEAITSFSFDFAKKYQFPGHSGNIIDFAWADNGNVYLTHCDAAGFGNVAGNFGIDMISGEITGSWPDYDFSGLSGHAVNPMHDKNEPEWDYGAPGGTDCWKTTSLICVDGVLYLFITPKNSDATMRQTAEKVRMIKSADHGVTWSGNSSKTDSMFPDMDFGAPAFIKYGQNSALNIHDSKKYVYTVFNNGFMSNGDFVILGRVLKSKIGDLDAADWQFYTGPAGVDATAGSDWTNDVRSPDITKLIEDPGNLGQCDITYIEPLGRYIILTWGWLYDDGSFRDPEADSWLSYTTPHFNRSFTTFWQVYESPMPWGGWTKVGSTIYSNDPDAFYNPHIMNNFMEIDENNPNVVHTFVGTAGEWENDCRLVNDTNRCNLNMIPLTLYKGNVLFAKAPSSSYGRWEKGTHADSSVSTQMSGDYLDFEIIVAKAGYYRISTHAFNSVSYIRPLEIYVNDMLMDTDIVSAENGWSILFSTAVFKTGCNKVRIVSIGTYTELDYITWGFESRFINNGVFSGANYFNINLDHAGLYRIDLNFYNYTDQFVTKRIMINGRICGNRRVRPGDGLITVSMDSAMRNGMNVISISSSDKRAVLDSISWKPSYQIGSINSYRFLNSYGDKEVLREYKISTRIAGLYDLNIDDMNGNNRDYPRELYVNDIYIGKCNLSSSLSTKTPTGRNCRVMLMKGENFIKIYYKGHAIDFGEITWNLVPLFRDFGATNASEPTKCLGFWVKGRESGTLKTSENGAFADYDINVNTEGLYNIFIITCNGNDHKSSQEIYINNKLVSSLVTNRSSSLTRISINEYLYTGNNVLCIKCTGPFVENKMIFWSLSSPACSGIQGL